LNWIAEALDVDREEEREPVAALTWTLVEGFVIFDALGNHSKATSGLADIALRSAAG